MKSLSSKINESLDASNVSESAEAFIKNIANDYQFDKKSDDYIGHLNITPKDHSKEAQEMVDVITKYNEYMSLLKKHKLKLQKNPTKTEMIFIGESVEDVNEALNYKKLAKQFVDDEWLDADDNIDDAAEYLDDKLNLFNKEELNNSKEFDNNKTKMSIEVKKLLNGKLKSIFESADVNEAKEIFPKDLIAKMKKEGINITGEPRIEKYGMGDKIIIPFNFDGPGGIQTPYKIDKAIKGSKYDNQLSTVDSVEGKIVFHILNESLEINEGKLQKLFLQVYPDKSTSDSFIEYDLKTMKITKVNYTADEPELKLNFKKGDSITKEWISDFLGESVNEAKISSDSEFIEYGEKMLKKAHGDDYDQAKADKTLQGILKDADGDYGKAVGALQGGMAEDADGDKVDEHYTFESFINEAKNISFSVSTDKDFDVLRKALADKDLYDVLYSSGSRTFTTNSKDDAKEAFEIAKKLHIKLGKPNSKDVQTMTMNYDG